MADGKAATLAGCMPPPVSPVRARSPLHPVALAVVAWAAPGAGHLLLGKRDKAVVFAGAILLLFVAGLWLDGRIFPFEPSEPLVALAALANVGVGVPYLLAWIGGLGAGTVTAAAYEYANTYLIVAGLLNALVALDAYDVAVGRKA
jgi:hypothetical protein